MEQDVVKGHFSKISEFFWNFSMLISIDSEVFHMFLNVKNSWKFLKIEKRWISHKKNFSCKMKNWRNNFFKIKNWKRTFRIDHTVGKNFYHFPYQFSENWRIWNFFCYLQKNVSSCLKKFFSIPDFFQITKKSIF